MGDVQGPKGFLHYVRETLPNEESQWAYDAAVARLEKLQNDIEAAIAHYFTEIGAAKQSAVLGLSSKKTTSLPVSGKTEDLPTHEELFDADEVRFNIAKMREEAALLQKELNAYKENLQEKKQVLASFREKAEEEFKKLSRYSLMGVQARAFGLWIKSGFLEGALNFRKLIGKDTEKVTASLRQTDEKIDALDEIAAKLKNIDVVASVRDSEEVLLVEEHNQSVHAINALIHKLSLLQTQLDKIHTLDTHNKELTQSYHTACEEIQPYFQNAGGQEYLKTILSGHQALEQYDQALETGRELSSKELHTLLDALFESMQTLASQIERPQNDSAWGALWQTGGSKTKRQKMLEETHAKMARCYQQCQKSLQMRAQTLFEALQQESSSLLTTSGLNSDSYSQKVKQWRKLQELCSLSTLPGRSTPEQEALYKRLSSQCEEWLSLLGQGSLLHEALQTVRTQDRADLNETEDLLLTLPTKIQRLACSLTKTGVSPLRLQEIEAAMRDEIAQLTKECEKRQAAFDKMDTSWLQCNAIQQGFITFAELVADIDPQNLQAQIGTEAAEEEKIAHLEREILGLQQQLANVEGTIAILGQGGKSSVSLKMTKLDEAMKDLQDAREQLDQLEHPERGFLGRMSAKFLATPAKNKAEIERQKGFLKSFETRVAVLSEDISRLQTANLTKESLDTSLQAKASELASLKRKRSQHKHLLETLQMKQLTYELFTEYKEGIANYQETLSQVQSDEMQENRTLIQELKEMISSLYKRIDGAHDPATKEALEMQLKTKQIALSRLVETVRPLYENLDQIRQSTEGIFIQLADCTQAMRHLLLKHSA